MLPDKVREAVEMLRPEDGRPGSMARRQTEAWAAIKAHLLAREAEVERLRAIEKERWDVVATRNAAVMRAEKAEALLREAVALLHPDTDEHKRITAHLSENSRG